jgi:F-type H+-transporting ATPase subunit beta
LEESAMSNRAVDVIETGIRPLDLLAPVRHGDLVRWDAGFGCGHVACLTELTRNLLSSGYRGAVWTGFEDEYVNERELLQALSQLGERELVTLMLAPGALSAEERLRHVEGVGARLEELTRQAPGRYLVVLFQDEAQVADPALAFPALNRRGADAVTAICTTPVRFPAEPARPLELVPPVSVRVVHDLKLVERRMFPAVDGLLTTSVNLTPEVVGAEHVEASAAARSLLEGYLALDPDLHFPDLFVFPKGERSTVTRGQRLFAFLTQAFKVSEVFSGMPGEWAPLERTLDGLRGLLAGELDDVPFREVLYSGRLPRQG